MKILIINGPNLNILGVREPNIYGHESFEDYLKKLHSSFPTVEIDYHQSNSEGELIDLIQNQGSKNDGVIINAGAYTHTSLAISDAVRSLSVPCIEVHLSNVYKRESYRQHSYLSPVVQGVIGGFGLDSYRLGIEALLTILQ